MPEIWNFHGGDVWHSVIRKVAIKVSEDILSSHHMQYCQLKDVYEYKIRAFRNSPLHKS